MNQTAHGWRPAQADNNRMNDHVDTSPDMSHDHARALRAATASAVRAA